FEERRLRARARAVDLVREEHVREDRPLAEDELRGALVVDGDAHHIAGEQIRCKLHASEIAADGARQGTSEGGLADAGDVLDEEVAPCEERDERELDSVSLSLERP